MNEKLKNPSSNVPAQSPDRPLGDRGMDGKTWTPPEAEQGISNRQDDEDEQAARAEDGAENE